MQNVKIETYMREPRAIRIFDTSEEAERACEIIKSGGFECYIKEDMFGELTIPEVRIPARFRLFVERVEIDNVARFLDGLKKIND